METPTGDELIVNKVIHQWGHRLIVSPRSPTPPLLVAMMVSMVPDAEVLIGGHVRNCRTGRGEEGLDQSKARLECTWQALLCLM